MPDACFAHPRLAAIYDEFDLNRRDLDLYESIVSDLEARSVLDVGCGTGVLARRLAARGIEVTGLDPARASLDVARRRRLSENVRWIEGDVSALGARSADLALLTANVAQVFLDDDEWSNVLASARSALRPGGHLVFETRIPAARGWEEWTPEHSLSAVNTVEGPVVSWVELTAVELPFVSFRWTYRFLDDGAELTSDSTLRFRERDELTESLEATGFAVREVRDAPDRPGREWVFIAALAS